VAMWTSARQTKRKIVISLLNTSAHNLLYGGGSKLETLLRGDVNFRSTNEVEVLIIAGSVSDARVVEYVSVSCRNWHNLLYGGASKLETLLRGDVNFCSTNEVEVLIVISFSTQVLISCCTVADARYRVCVGVGVGVGVGVEIGDASP